MLTNARIDLRRAATTTGTTTSDAGTADDDGRARRPAATDGRRACDALRWSGGSDLDKHVGHKIQVTGKTGRGTRWITPLAGYDHAATRRRRERRDDQLRRRLRPKSSAKTRTPISLGSTSSR